MSRVHFDVGDESTVVVSGVLVTACIEADGGEGMKINILGEPSPWTKIGLLQAALDRTREQLKSQWGQGE